MVDTTLDDRVRVIHRIHSPLGICTTGCWRTASSVPLFFLVWASLLITTRFFARSLQSCTTSTETPPVSSQPVRRDTPTHTTPRHRASSWDSRAVFRSSPYSRPSASSLASSKLSSARRHTGSSTLQTSTSKGNLSLTQMQADHENYMDALDYSTEQYTQLALLKNEQKIMKWRAYIRDKEVAHLNAENTRDRVEAEKIRQRMMESKQINTELLQAEAKVIALKVQLAQLNARLGGLDPSVSPDALVLHTTLSPSSGFTADQLSAVVLEYLMMGEDLANPSQR